MHAERHDGRVGACAGRRALGIAALALCAGCAAGPAEFTRRPSEPIAWPAGDPRVEVVMAYGGTRDAVRRPGFWESLLSVFGSDEIRIVAPYGLAMDGHGRLYVADTGLAAVHRLDLETGEHVLLPGAREAGLRMPVGVAVGGDGRVYVSDSKLARIVVLDADGDYLMSFGEKEKIGRPTGMVWDRRRGRLLVVDTTGCRILAYDADGRPLGSFGKRGTGPGEFNFPTNVALSPSGEVIVSDSMNFRIQVLSGELQPLRSFGFAGRGPGTFASPKGVASDSDGHVYVVDGMFDNVQIFDPQGRLLLTFGSSGAGLGQFSLPTGILIDGRDRIFVSEGGNSRIQVFRYLKTSQEDEG